MEKDKQALKKADAMILGEKPCRLDQFSWFLTRHRLAVLVITLVVAAVVGCGSLRVRGEIILQDLFPYDHPYLKIHGHFSRIFGGGGSGAVIAIKAKHGDIFTPSILSKIQNITNEVVLWEEVYPDLTVSLARRTVKVIKYLSKGEIAIESLMWPDVPADEVEIARLKKHIFSNPNYNGTLVSKDGKAATLFTEFRENISYQAVFYNLRDIQEKYTDEEISVHVVGFPILMGWIYSYKPQIMTVFAVSIAFMLLILFLVFRNITGMVVPMCFGVICSAIGIGFIGWTGINFSPLLYVLAFLVGARMVSHSVQITHRYFEEYSALKDVTASCYHTMRTMMRPNWAGVATDATGFFVLIFAKILLMQQVAVFMSFWMACIGLCGIITPILCSYLPVGGVPERWDREKWKLGIFDRMCLSVAGASLGRYGRFGVFAVCLGALAFCLWQAGTLKIGDPTPGSPLLWPDHRYNQDQAFVDKTFNASSENLMLFYEGEKASIYDPVVLNTFEDFDRYMEYRLSDIRKSSNSIIDMIKMVNTMFHDGDKMWHQLPKDEVMLMGLMGSVRDGTERGTLNRFVDNKLERAQITVYFSDHTSNNLLRIRDAAVDFFNERPMKLAHGEFKLAGGRIGMEIAVNEEMKRAHVLIDGFVLAAIFILCSLFYRSGIAGLMLTLPLILANLFAFAYMAMNNIGLSINTLPVAAVGVGVGVDFAIYIYSRCIEELSQQETWYDAIMAAVRTSGKAVVYTGLTMILPILTWYFLSDLKFQAQMGIFLAVIMSANVLLAITLHPLLIYLIKPKFILKQAVVERSQVACTTRLVSENS